MHAANRFHRICAQHRALELEELEQDVEERRVALAVRRTRFAREQEEPTALLWSCFSLATVVMILIVVLVMVSPPVARIFQRQ
jgi:hypothetical protein